MKKIYIVGAHSRARTLGVYLKKLDPETVIEAYLVDNDEANAKEQDGVLVLHFDEETQLHTEYLFYLGTRGLYHSALTQKLLRMGIKAENIIPVTPALDRELRNRYLKLCSREEGRKFETLCEVPRIVPAQARQREAESRIYVIRSAFDKPLEQEYELPQEAAYLQVGAALTEKRISARTDDAGENISGRNRQFCELTGLYWLWKHASEEMVGLEHYRRHFLLPKDWKERMIENNIDVILPTPLYVAPSLAQNYRERHVAADWDYMMEYVQQTMPDEYEPMMDFFEKTSLYSPCNMFIMRREVMCDLCEWLFPILFACAAHGGEKEDSYQNRYPGFLAERLLTFFFQKNQEKYHVVYADKSFLG